MDNNENRNTIEIDLKRLVVVLWRRLWIMLLVGAMLGAAAFSYAWFCITPTYTSSVQLYVNNNYEGSPGFSSSQVTAAQGLANTYMVILESRSVLEQVAEQTELPYSYAQLKAMVSASTINETEVFKVTVTSTNYVHAALIANAIADVLPARLTSVVEGSSVRVVDYAVENPNPVGPNYQKYAIYGFAMGFMLVAVIAVIAELLNTTITTEDYLAQRHSDLPLLAVIPGAENPRAYAYKRGYYRGYYASEEKKKPAKKSGGAKK